MKRTGILLVVATGIALAGCHFHKLTPSEKAFGKAAWIGYEPLADSMKVVPAVHGNGDGLGGKCIQRSVVPLFRKAFTEEAAVRKATISICGLGEYELYINGQKIGDRFLSPGWTLYQKRCLYNTFDVTRQIRKGENVIGAIVGNGFFYINRERYRKMVVAYGYPRLIFNLKMEMSDGTVKHILSDRSCRVSPSPITYSSIYGGEDYDARLEQQGWSNPGFNDSAWKEPVILHDQTGELAPEEDNPVKVMQEFDTQKISHSGTGRTLYDFGQNASGIIELKVKGNKGAEVIIRPDELLNEQGNITQGSGGGPYEWHYILKGGGEEVWRPRFTYYGFRYADVEIVEPAGAGGKTAITGLKLLHTRNSAPEAGSFSCSDELFNRIFNLINWGIRSNMASVATDCPHREKLGWLEQTYLIGPSMHYNYDIHSLYAKIVNDMMDSQPDSGLVPDIAPEYVHFEGGFRDSPEWGSASVILPWLLYEWYGDRETLEKAYPMMKKYVDYLGSRAKDSILDYGLGDWYDLGPNPPGVAQLTPIAVTATAIYYYDLKIVSKAANMFGQVDDYGRFRTQLAGVKRAFLKKFYNPVTGVCSTGSQTAYAIALYTGLIPKNDRERVLQNLADSITRNHYALTSGDIGFHFLVRVLCDNGRSDILFKMNSRTDVPGYGYQLGKGATALTESWAALPTSSNDHMMLGHLMEWFYSGLGGISQPEDSVAYSHIIIAPKPAGNIRWVKCTYRSVKGPIVSSWEIKGNGFYIETDIPNGSHATIRIPMEYLHSFCQVLNRETHKPARVKYINNAFEVGPGKYLVVAK